MGKIFREIVDLCNQGKAIALATVVESEGSTPGKAGAKMIVKKDGTTIGTIGGGQVEFAVIKEGIEAIRTKTPKLMEYELKEADDLLCGGRMKIFVEPILISPHLYIFGAGHIGQALTRIAATTGFDTFVIDDREEFLTKERFPEAKQLISGDYERTISDLQLDHNSYIVIATRDHRIDETVLEGCIGRDYVYIGMVASKEKANTIFARLKEKGISEERLKEVHTPIGLSTGSKTPGEIAVSIMAEIISVKNSKNWTQINAD